MDGSCLQTPRDHSNQSYPKIDFRIRLIAQERALTIISRTLKQWQLTEHNGENSLEQPQETDEPL